MNAKAGQLREVPGPRTREWFERHEAVAVKTTVSSALVFERADGIYLYDPDDNEYLDAGSPGTNAFGYGTSLAEFLPEIIRVLASGLPRFATPDWPTTETIRAKEIIQKSVPLSGRGLVLGTRAGGLAIESAIKAMRKARLFRPDYGEPIVPVAQAIQEIFRSKRPERPNFLAFWGAFHGRPHGALSLMDPQKPARVCDYNLPYHVERVRFPHAGYPDPTALVDEEFARLGRRTLQSINAMFLEMVQGEGGVRVIDRGGLRRIYQWCRAYDIAVVVDEIQTGMGRTGSCWCYEQYDIRPDAVTIGKSLGGNIEDANALVIREDLSFKQLNEESSTYDLPPLEAALAAKAIELLTTEHIPERARVHGAILGALLHERFSGKPYVMDVRGIGLMRGIEFSSIAFRDAFIQEAERHGLLLLPAGFTEGHDLTLVSGPAVRFLPPLIINQKEIDLVATIAHQAYETALNE